MTKPKLLLKDNYLSMIKNSEGTKLFQDFFGMIKGKKENLTKNGRLSCALFVSLILHHFNLLQTSHLTVDGTIKDMKKSSWFKIKKPKEGGVILWEKKQGHYHIGFFLSQQQAISNDRQKRMPKIHHITFKGKRKIEANFWHNKLN